MSHPVIVLYLNSETDAGIDWARIVLSDPMLTRLLNDAVRVTHGRYAFPKMTAKRGVVHNVRGDVADGEDVSRVLNRLWQPEVSRGGLDD